MLVIQMFVMDRKPMNGRIKALLLTMAVSTAVACAPVHRFDGGSLRTEGVATASYGGRVDRRSRPRVDGGALIMPFFNHNFGSACFDTLKCRVLYKNRYDTNDNEPRGGLTDRIRRNLSGSWILFDTPSVAKVTWTSKDGSSHDEEIDLGNIFRSKLVRYAADLDVSEVDLAVSYISPEIILVVEDRVVYVYMKAVIPLRHPTDPTNRHTNMRRDLIAVHTQEF